MPDVWDIDTHDLCCTFICKEGLHQDSYEQAVRISGGREGARARGGQIEMKQFFWNIKCAVGKERVARLRARGMTLCQT